ncbi:16S rRNA (uracil(1498)-N(3))-methyltransferase [Altererythrobacter aerius]|uniref:Ribosomal RNA small subunit methyltransferase E n=1 Tax=Tsuneonella aeria TaxID=1837929 RepID=A0A6I4TJ51_9SPHN|nr:16S rRNA (uracil(1498)-N(3))-methyltransferase [Tsuneonella aeria]MXO76085.1 16S rRNA (uracil(1498)-N(3))-methyltransferase [Tsuneonella aeria]
MPATPAWPPRSAPRLFVPPPLAEGAHVEVEGNQAHYLSRVMRVAAGDTVILCDDQTGEWAARVVETAKRSVIMEPVERLRPREAVPDLWLCPALIKKDRFDVVLEKATELGVAEIRPFIARRSVADRLNPDRARSAVIEAAEQCARTALPVVAAPVSLDAMLADWPEGRTLFFADEAGGAAAVDAFGAGGGEVAAILVGPEGGFDDSERAAIRALPRAVPISLGPRILRAETAAIAATALWMGVAGDWQH